MNGASADDLWALIVSHKQYYSANFYRQKYAVPSHFSPKERANMVRMSRLIAMTTGQINVNRHALVQILQGQITQAHVDEVQGVKPEELLALCLLLKQEGKPAHDRRQRAAVS